MEAHIVLYGISFTTGLIGIAGLDGVITYGTGLMTCTVLLMICAISAVVGMHEDGVFRKKIGLRTDQSTRPTNNTYYAISMLRLA